LTANLKTVNHPTIFEEGFHLDTLVGEVIVAGTAPVGDVTPFVVVCDRWGHPERIIAYGAPIDITTTGYKSSSFGAVYFPAGIYAAGLRPAVSYTVTPTMRATSGTWSAIHSQTLTNAAPQGGRRSGPRDSPFWKDDDTNTNVAHFSWVFA
jgi:hypothetical protein